MANEEIFTDDYLKNLAVQAYDFCVDHFGEPDDPQRKYVVMLGPLSYSTCAYGWLLGDYTIMINKRSRLEEEIVRVMGHEMYHRVTMQRAGAHRTPWLNEALAVIAQQWFLRELGFSDYAIAVESAIIRNVKEYSIAYLKDTRKKRDLISRLSGKLYSKEFGDQVQRFALELERIVGKEQAAKICRVATLEDWISQLPADLQAVAQELTTVRPVR